VRFALLQAEGIAFEIADRHIAIAAVLNSIQLLQTRLDR